MDADQVARRAVTPEGVREIVREEIEKFHEAKMQIKIYDDPDAAPTEPLYLKLADTEFRLIVREEIASLAGKALRRLQDENFTRSFERNTATDAAKDVIGHFWGEILAEYGDRAEPEKVV